MSELNRRSQLQAKANMGCAPVLYFYFEIFIYIYIYNILLCHIPQLIKKK